jgi:GT2 family glycosyltransferase
VIPSARLFPLSLMKQLENQAVEGDEILLVKNHPRLAERDWAGISSGRRASTKWGVRSDVTRDRTITLRKEVPIIILHSHCGAAAARNLGWQRAKNKSILFLDDDITIQKTFLNDVRQHISQRPIADVVTFRILTKSIPRWFAPIEAAIALDRGARTYDTSGIPLQLASVWTYGAGAAMIIDRGILKETGGFKDQLGAGRRNGGVEDAEFLWHASRHGVVQYHGAVSVLHKVPSSFENLSRKMREYGRAIGNLGGMTGSVEGFRYVSNYCSHLDETRSSIDLLGLSKRNLSLARSAFAAAVSETIHAYRMSLVQSRQRGILCNRCRGPCS